MSSGRTIILKSPGPISDAFLHDDSFVSICIGPVGSGKTMTGLQKGLRLLARQHGRVDKNGMTWRKGRFGVLRESYPNIDKNILPSWFRLVPETEGKFSWKAPYTHSFRKVLRFEMRDGRRVPVDILDAQFEFQAIGDKSVEEIMRGWEVNGFLTDEADLQPEEILAFGSGRVGRFSDLDPKLVVDPQMIFTSNMPWTNNWLYRLGIQMQAGEIFDADVMAALKGRKLVSCFVQPGGREPDAENLHNLPDGYYALQAALNKARPNYVSRMIDNKPTPPQHGQAVHPEFKHHLHVSTQTIPWDASRKLIIGCDQGLNAAASFMQFDSFGRRRVLAEVAFFKKDGRTLEKVGPEAFGKALAQKLRDRFPGIHPDDMIIKADPAAFPAPDNKNPHSDWPKLVQAQLPKGMKIKRAKSNSPDIRQAAVKKGMIETGGLLIDPSCTSLIGAYLGGYHFAKSETGDNEEKGNVPVANTVFTHIADADEYGAMEGDNTLSALRGRTVKGSARRITVQSDYDMLGEAA